MRRLMIPTALLLLISQPAFASGQAFIFTVPFFFAVLALVIGLVAWLISPAGSVWRIALAAGGGFLLLGIGMIAWLLLHSPSHNAHPSEGDDLEKTIREMNDSENHRDERQRGENVPKLLSQKWHACRMGHRPA